MKSFLIDYGGAAGRNWRHGRFNPKHTALIAGIYTLNVSFLVVLLCSWRINVNNKKYSTLEDVYYGVQISYVVVIGTQLFMMILTVVMCFGIHKGNIHMVIPWIAGSITCMALEALAMVYSNVLRDHVNKEFDALCRAEAVFYISRTIVHVIAVYTVVRYCNLLQAGEEWSALDIVQL